MRLRWRERCWWCITRTRTSAYFGKCRGIVPVVQVRLRWDKLLWSRRAEAGVMGQPCPRTLPDMRQAYTSGGLDHGVGHFRSLSMTRQRHLLASHGIAMSHEGLCQVFLQLLSPQPIVFQQVTNTFSFNDLQEKQENQIVIQIVYFVMI